MMILLIVIALLLLLGIVIAVLQASETGRDFIVSASETLISLASVILIGTVVFGFIGGAVWFARNYDDMSWTARLILLAAVLVFGLLANWLSGAQDNANPKNLERQS